MIHNNLTPNRLVSKFKPISKVMSLMISQERDLQDEYGKTKYYNKLKDISRNDNF